MLFCQVFYLTIVQTKCTSNFSFEPMKVPKNKQIQAKLINKFFVKKTTYTVTDSVCERLFLVLALYM